VLFRSLDAGIQVSVLDTEGGVLASMKHYTKTMATDRSLYRRISRYFSWGPKLAEYLEREGVYSGEQIVVTGSPRTDFYAPGWREAALRSSMYVDEYPLPMVLVNGNFPIANPRFQTPEEEARVLVEYFNYDREVVVEWQRTARQAMHELSALCNRLAAKFPQATFVYRPHPFERSETYGDLLDSRPNLHLVKAGTVEGWILRSSAVIQKSCSTAIEAGIAGVAALSPAWIPTAVSMPAAEAVSAQYDTQEELERALESVLAGTFEWPSESRAALDEVISDWFYKVDGRAHERIAAHLLELARRGDGTVLEKCRDLVYATNSGGDSLRQKARAGVLKTLNLPVDWSLRRSLNLLGRTNENGNSDPSWTPASEKYFDAESVRKLAEAIEPYMKSGLQAGKIKVKSSQERGDYHFGYVYGRAITIFSD